MGYPYLGDLLTGVILQELNSCNNQILDSPQFPVVDIHPRKIFMKITFSSNPWNGDGLTVEKYPGRLSHPHPFC